MAVQLTMLDVGYANVTDSEGRYLGTVVNRHTPGCGPWWAISPGSDAHNPATAPTVGNGRTAEEAARFLLPEDPGWVQVGNVLYRRGTEPEELP